MKENIYQERYILALFRNSVALIFRGNRVKGLEVTNIVKRFKSDGSLGDL